MAIISHRLLTVVLMSHLLVVSVYLGRTKGVAPSNDAVVLGVPKDARTIHSTVISATKGVGRSNYFCRIRILQMADLKPSKRKLSAGWDVDIAYISGGERPILNLP